MSNVGRTPYRSAFGNLYNHSRKLCITITQEVAPKKMLTCHEFTRSGHGLKHIEQYLLELPQMYEKTLGDSSVHCQTALALVCCSLVFLFCFLMIPQIS